MTGKGHRITAFAIVMATTGSLIASMTALSGSVFPDTVEHILWRKNRNRHHRRTSHWFVIYLAGFWLCRAHSAPLPLRPADFQSALFFSPIRLLLACSAFWFLGPLIHIACDACCGKVPLWLPWKKSFGRKFFQMSKAHGEMSPGESIFVAFISLSCLCAWLERFVL